MCNLYSITKAQDAMRALFRVARDRTGNLPPMPGVFPDYPAPIVRVARRRTGTGDGADGECRRRSSR